MSQLCNNIIRDYERGTLICEDTGEIIDEDSIDQSPEWRAFTHDEWRRRAHAGFISQTVHDVGLTTDIDTKEINSTIYSYRKTAQMLKLRYLNKKIRVNRHERKIVEALTNLNHICALLEIPEQVKETAAIILKKIFYSIQPKRDDIKTLAVVSLVIASRKHRLPLRAKQLLQEFNIDEDKYWKLLSEVYMKTEVNGFKSYSDPRIFVPSIISNLKLSQKVHMLASKIIEMLKSHGLTEGKDPAGIAAATVYISSIVLDEKKTQKEVAKAANVTEVTIRNRYRDIMDKIVITIYV